MQHIARWLVILNKVTAVVSRIAARYATGQGPHASAEEKSGRSGKGRIAIGESVPILRPIDLDSLMPSQESSDGHKGVPKSLILAASTGAEKAPVNTAQISGGDCAEIYTFRHTRTGLTCPPDRSESRALRLPSLELLDRPGGLAFRTVHWHAGCSAGLRLPSFWPRHQERAT